MPELAAFHFLRPLWLWALVPTALLAVALARRARASSRWRKVVAPHLLEHLVVRPRRGFAPRPPHLLAAVLVLATIALAGPSWRREPPPFTEDIAPLVLAIDLSRTMLVTDVQPSRLERARQKVRDLLATRPGAPTALLVYAGTAHRVLPLTDDAATILGFLDALSPDVMPVTGKDPAAAIRLAREMLAEEATPGTILFLTDGIAASAAPAFAGDASAGARDQVVVLAVATEAGGDVPGSRERSALDRAGLETLEREAGAKVIGVTYDDEDVALVARRIDTHLAAVQREDAEGRWRDDGWWLTIALVVLVLPWFRRGWVVQWEG